MIDPKRDIRKIGGIPEQEVDMHPTMDGYGRDYDNIHGKPAPGSCNAETRMELFPPHVINLQMEIMCYHPELVAEFNRLVEEEEQMDASLFYGMIGAYCGLVMDGDYGQETVAEQLLKALENKRLGNVILDSQDVAIMPTVLLR